MCSVCVCMTMCGKYVCIWGVCDCVSVCGMCEYMWDVVRVCECVYICGVAGGTPGAASPSPGRDRWAPAPRGLASGQRAGK